MLAEDHRSVAFGHEEDRWAAPEEDLAFGLDTDSEESPHELEENFDNLVARYFGDVRQFALLNRAEEQALWCRIESAQKRERRALYTSPVALPTLMHVWHQVEREEISLDHMLRAAEALTSQQADLRGQFGDAVLDLQNIATRLQALRLGRQTALHTASKGRAIRRAYAELWQQWCKTWEALALHPQVYDTLRKALETEHAAQPHNLALHAARRAWQHAHERLTQVKAGMIRANL
jgi:hypothetical protein